MTDQFTRVSLKQGFLGAKEFRAMNQVLFTVDHGPMEKSTVLGLSILVTVQVTLGNLS